MARTPTPQFTINANLGSLTPYDGPLGDDDLLEDRELINVDLSTSRARLVDLLGCRWRGSSLHAAVTEKLTAADQDFDSCDLSLWSAEEASLTRVVIDNSRLSGAKWSAATAQQVAVRDTVA